MTYDDRLIDLVAQLPRHPTLRYGTRDLRSITHLIIHHSGDDGSPWSWARFHSDPEPQGRGWPGIAYAVAVMADGRGYKCQADSTISYHAGGRFNPTSIGLVLQGDLTKQEPTARQLAKLLLVARRYVVAYSIPLINVIGHRDAMPGKTECPGAGWVVEWLRAALR